MPKITQTGNFDPQLAWIDPIGGLGDCLWLSSVLFDVWKTQGRKFGLCRKEPYSTFYRNHPAIAAIASPPLHFPTIKVDYWSYETIGPGNSRPYQILSRMFGLKTPREETLWHPLAADEIEATKAFPFGDRFLVVAPTSNAPRKMWSYEKWKRLLELMRAKFDLPILQLGVDSDARLPGVFGLQGMTSSRQGMALVARAMLTISVDAFPLHAAAWAKTPSIGLWGPTDPAVFGHREQANIRSASSCPNSCFGPRKYDVYVSPCDKENGTCIDAIAVEEVMAKAEQLLGARPLSQ